MLGSQHIEHPFMIDTGADYTVLQWEAGRTLLGAWYRDPSNLPRGSLVTVTGVGDATLRCLVQRAGLRFMDADRNPFRIAHSLLIAEPPPRSVQRRAHWEMPSLLGRDILQHFELSLFYDPPSVALTLRD